MRALQRPVLVATDREERTRVCCVQLAVPDQPVVLLSVQDADDLGAALIDASSAARHVNDPTGTGGDRLAEGRDEIARSTR